MKWKKFTFETVDSTNKTAMHYAVGSVIIAKQQTAGRGRYGKKWISEKGNLYMSIVLKNYGIQTPQMAFVVAVAVANALGIFGVNVHLKWPNDILLETSKVAGILLENMDDKLVVGIGVNCHSCPENLPYPVTHLHDLMSPESLSDAILAELNHSRCLFETHGFEPIRQLWKKMSVGLGKKITVNLPTETLIGTFKDLGQSGALILEMPDKQLKEITAGAVFLI